MRDALLPFRIKDCIQKYVERVTCMDKILRGSIIVLHSVVVTSHIGKMLCFEISDSDVTQLVRSGYSGIARIFFSLRNAKCPHKQHGCKIWIVDSCGPPQQWAVQILYPCHLWVQLAFLFNICLLKMFQDFYFHSTMIIELLRMPSLNSAEAGWFSCLPIWKLKLCELLK